MKAWVLHGVNELTLEDVPRPALGNIRQNAPGEVLVKVRAAGICGSDIPRIYRTGAHRHPLIPGHEFAGEVTELGEGVDEKWLGQRVGIFPLIPCKVCGPCQAGQYEMCRNYDYLGSRRDGGFARYAAVPVWNLLRLPSQVSFEEAAMLEPMSVAVHAMRRRNPKETDTVAVCGLGTIGLLLVMFLKEAGVRNIYAIGNKEFQKNLIVHMGLEEDHYCDSRKKDAETWLKERTKDRGADLFFECVGKKETCMLAVGNTAPAGSVVLVGNPDSDICFRKDIYWKILRNQLTVTGTWNSSFSHDLEDDWNYVLKRLEQRKVDPTKVISHRFSLEGLNQGMELMRDKSEDYGKVMGVF